MYLPDDPTIKRRQKSRHTGKVDGIAYLRNAYLKLERATDRALEMLGIVPASLDYFSELNPELVEADFETEATVAVVIPGLTGHKALQTRYNPKDRSFNVEMIDLPQNDPEDSPVTLPEIVEFVRTSTRGAEGLLGSELTFIGDRQIHLPAVKGNEVAGPWRIWVWRFSVCGTPHYVLAFKDDKCPWIACRAARPGQGEEATISELFRRYVLDARGREDKIRKKREEMLRNRKRDGD